MELVVAKPLVEPTPVQITQMEEVTPSECKHKNKKSLYRMADIRKRLKQSSKKGHVTDICDDCLRNDPKSDSVALWLCVSCGFYGCEKEGHAQKHFQADRSGAGHVLYLCLGDRKFKCFSCNLMMDANDDAGGPMKTFLSEYANVKKMSERRGSGSSQGSETKSSASNANTLNEEIVLSKKERRNSCMEEKNTYVKERRVDGVLDGDSSPRKGWRSRAPTVKGLINLGNTCFFNSTMQCLMHTYTLRHYVDYVGVLDSLEIGGSKVSVGDKQVEVPRTVLQLETFYGPLNDRFANFIHEFGDGRNLHPSALFTEIAKKAPRFRGWAQQDAHELLRYLMDGLRTEELQRYKDVVSAFLKVPKGATSKAFNPETAILAKGMLKACGRPLLDAIFGGTLLQAIKCSKCGHLSCIYEEFLDLSIPIPSGSTPSKFLNGALKIHKPSASPLSKHQKKKEKAIARKRLRRKSRRESTSSNRGDTPDVETSADGNASIAQNESDLEEEEEAEMSDDNDLEFEKLRVSDKDPEECLQTLGEEIERESGRSLFSCLSAFTAKEILSYPNAYECEKCCVPQNKDIKNGAKKKTVEAEKRYFVFEPPTVLTLHLKRFEQHHYASGRVSTSKVRGHVAFPLVLDIAPYCTRTVKRVQNGSRKVLYSLYGIVSHSGDLSGGHYVAYVRSRHPSLAADKFFREVAKGLLPEEAKFEPMEEFSEESTSEKASPSGSWFYVSDSRVCAVDEAKVLEAEAYILFYERVA